MPNASRVYNELARIQTFFPALTALGDGFAAERPWEGLTIGLNMHLTTLTATLAGLGPPSVTSLSIREGASS